MANVTIRAVRLLFAVLAVTGFLLFGAYAAHAQISFNVFTGIPFQSMYPFGIAYGGNKFVVSVQGEGQALYSTNLDGSNLQKFAPQISLPALVSNFTYDHGIASSIGLGGFPTWDFYVGVENGILHISNDGTKSNAFVSGLSASVRHLHFDTVGTFNHNLLATTLDGHVYQIDSSGSATVLASIGEDAWGMDIVPIGAGFGPFDGQLIVMAESSGLMRAIDATGRMSVVNGSHPVSGAPSISFVPLNMGTSGSSVEGLYVADWMINVLKADIGQFAAFKGDAIISNQYNSVISRVHWNGSTFEFTDLIQTNNNPDEVIFITPAMINPGTTCPAPNVTKPVNEPWCAPFCQKPLKRPNRN